MTDILQLPIDQYQRYRLAGGIVDALREGRNALKVLEVGGYPPKLKEFLLDDMIVVTDRVAARYENYLRADALALPFAEDAFDVVVSLDVLEHIPQGDRLDFLEGMKDVAAKYVVIGCPFDDGNRTIMDAEKILVDFIKERHGYEHEFFAEHLSLGLPDYSLKLKTLSDEDWETVTIPNGYFPRWFMMTLLDYMLQGKHDPLLAKLRRFYNLHFFKLDNREPSYRHFIVAARNGFTDKQRENLKNLVSPESSMGWPPLEYAKTLMELARLDANEAIKERIATLEHDLAARDEEIYHLKKHIAELTDFNEKVKNLYSYRIYSRLFKKEPKE